MKEVEIRYLDYRTIKRGSKILILGSVKDAEAVISKIVRNMEGTTLKTLEKTRLKEIYQIQGMYLPAPDPDMEGDQPLHTLPSCLFDSKFPVAILDSINGFVRIPTRYLVLKHPKAPYSVWVRKLLSASSTFQLTQILSLNVGQKIPPSYLPYFTHLIVFSDITMADMKRVWKLFKSVHIETLGDFQSFISSLKASEALVKVDQTLYLTTNIIKS